MSNKIKNYLGAAIIIAILLIAYAAVSYVKTYSKSIQPSSFRSFAVSAEGKITAIPDIAQMTFSIKTEGGLDVADLQNKNAEKMNKAIAFVKENGVEAKDVKTANYSINPRYQYYSCSRSESSSVEPCPPAEIVGYTINQSVSVKIRDFKKIGDILSGVVKNGANEVSGIYFTIDEPTKLQEQARAEAITKAKEKAAAVAKAGGFRVGRLIAIEEGYASPYYDYSATKAMGIGGGESISAVAPAVEAGSQEISITMTLRYEIE